jgi:hypothetical protein
MDPARMRESLTTTPGIRERTVKRLIPHEAMAMCIGYQLQLPHNAIHCVVSNWSAQSIGPYHSQWNVSGRVKGSTS